MNGPTKCAVFLLLFTGFAAAQWTQGSGLYGAFATRLAVVGGDLLAATAGRGQGLYRSRDSGASWAPANRGLTSHEVWSLCVYGRLVFAGTQDSGIFVSEDSGTSWVATNAGLAWRKTTVSAITGNGTRLFAGTRDSGAFVSQDSGRSWQGMSAGLGSQVSQLLVSNGILYAATINGVYRFVDTSATWVSCSTGLPDLAVNRLAKHGTRLFAGTSRVGVYVSDDSGANWQAANVGLPHERVFSFLIVGDTVFAGFDMGGIYRSTDDGAQWTPFSSGMADSVAADMVLLGSCIYVTTEDHGVLRSASDRDNWSTVSAGMTDVGVSDVVADGSRLYLASSVGLYRSGDNGVTWEQFYDPYPNLPGWVSASGNMVNSGAMSTVFMSSDTGTTFRSSDSGLPPGAPITGMVARDSLLYVLCDYGVYASHDGGTTWERTSLVNPSGGYTCLAKCGEGILVGGLGKVYVSTDGVAWALANWPRTDAYVRCLAVSGTRAFAGTVSAGVFVSADSGRNWVASSAGLGATGVEDMAVEGTDVYLCTVHGVYVSEDSGANWNQLVPTVPAASATVSLAVNSTHVVVGTSHAGVWSIARTDLPVRHSVARALSRTARPRTALCVPLRSGRWPASALAADGRAVSIFRLDGRRVTLAAPAPRWGVYALRVHGTR